MKKRAQQLRKIMTPTERLLWSALRNHRLDGFGFRRQHPIGPFVVDFCCPLDMMVVEVDGLVHDFLQVAEYDMKRQVYLESLGYRVIRVSTDDVSSNLEGVVAYIRQHLSGANNLVVTSGSPPP